MNTHNAIPVESESELEGNMSEDQACPQLVKRRFPLRHTLPTVALVLGLVVALAGIGTLSQRTISITTGNDSVRVVGQNAMSLAAVPSQLSKEGGLDQEIKTQLADAERLNPDAVKDMRKMEHSRKARKLIEHINSQSPEEVKHIVDEAVKLATKRAVKKVHERHEAHLIQKAQGEREMQGLTTPRPGPLQRIFRAVGKLHNATDNYQTAKEKQRTIRAKQNLVATCVFGGLASADSVARITVGILSAASCPNSKGLRQKLCAVNALLVVVSISSLAANLAGMASSCAETTNVKALCAASVSGLVASLSQVGAGAVIVAEGCKSPQQFIRDNAAGIAALAGRKLSNAESAAEPVAVSLSDAIATEVPTAPARRLFLGGSKAVMNTQCALDVYTTTVSLAGIGIAIQAATNSCPKRPFKDFSGALQAILLRKALCTSDVSTILFAIGRVAVFLQIAVIHCAGGLNLQAICGAGVAALITSAAAISRFVAGLYSSCNVGLKLQKLQNLMALLGTSQGGVSPNATQKFKQMIGKLFYNEALSAGLDVERRLMEDVLSTTEDEWREEIWATRGYNMSYSEARRLAGLPSSPTVSKNDEIDPVAIWASMGYNLTDPNAEFLKKPEPETGNPEAFLRVMRPFLDQIGELEGTEDLADKWPLWQSIVEEEEEEL